MDATGGGVAVVSRLLWSAFQQQWAAARLLVLVRGSAPQPTFSEKVRYALTLAAIQGAGSTDWILFSHLGLAKPLGVMPVRLRRRYAIFLHGIEVWRPLTAGERMLLTGAELRLSNSAYTAARVMEMHPDVGPVVPCPLALPDRVPGHAPGSSGSPTAPLGPHAVLIVGRMLRSERYKGHDELIDAWPRVTAAVPDAQLVVAGAGDDLPRLREKAAGSVAAGSIVFTGFVDEDTLTGLYEQCALFALPSRAEGFGLVYLEAMAHRRACIGSVHDAARDVIVDGVTGRLVDQDDSDRLAETIVESLRDEQQRARMGEAGYQRLQEQFTFDRFSARLRPLLSGEAGAVAAIA
jgi:phosphatidylinositol alpha-1,6-mannosyltransferase